MPGAWFSLLAVLIALASWIPSERAAAANARSDQVILFLGRDFTGPAKTWSLRPDQPFLAVPYTGDEFRPVSASIKLGADVGVLLFEHPFFSTIDETCDYQLGNAADPELWWLSDKAMFMPGPQERGMVEGNLRPQEIASLILYRRASGPPPGALLLERRRYVNWDCSAPTKARGYKRLFVPVAAPPHRQGCFNLDAGLSYGASGKVALDFSAASELLLIQPRDLEAEYAQIDHRFTVSLHDDRDCAGAPATFSHPQSGARRFELKQFGFDRKARSVMLRYDQGAYDEMLLTAGQEPEDTSQAVVQTPPETDSQETPAESQVETPEEAQVEQVETPEEAQVEQVETEAEPAAQASPEPAAEAVEPATPAVAKSASSGEDLTDGPEPAGGSSDSAAASRSGETETAPQTAPDTALDTAPETELAASSTASSTATATSAPTSVLGESEADTSTGSLAPAGEAVSKAEVPEAEGTEAGEPETAALEAVAPEAETPQLEAPEAETPQAETTGFLVLPEAEPEAVDAGQTIKYPLLQGYRLNACFYQQEGCGEEAASEWCKARGFAGGAASFEIDENIGSLFPTLALGDLQLCANFVCDGFKEITCLP